jgi:GAF domain-containing protein
VPSKLPAAWRNKVKNMLKDGSVLANFHDVLSKRGLRVGLEFLNQRVPHRYTSVYRLHHDHLHRIAFIDKLGSSGAELANVALKESFCEIAVQEGALVVATNIKTDKRFETYPNPTMLGSYVGLPLASQRGELFGTFCHADEHSYPLSDAEFVFLNEAAKVLEAYLEQIFPSSGKRESQ